jgi:hypothetical protein
VLNAIFPLLRDLIETNTKWTITQVPTHSFDESPSLGHTCAPPWVFLLNIDLQEKALLLHQLLQLQQRHLHL